MKIVKVGNYYDLPSDIINSQSKKAVLMFKYFLKLSKNFSKIDLELSLDFLCDKFEISQSSLLKYLSDLNCYNNVLEYKKKKIKVIIKLNYTYEWKLGNSDKINNIYDFNKFFELKKRINESKDNSIVKSKYLPDRGGSVS